MERLIADTAKMTDIQDKLNITVKEGDLSFGNIVNAISVLQDKLNIAGATAQEAAGTIEGSLNAMKAAWENLVTDLGNGTADIEQDVENLTEYFGYAIDNITPVVENMVAQVPTALEGVVEAAGGIIPTIAQTIIDNAPNLLNSAFTMVSTLAQGIADNLPVLVPSAVEAVIDVADTLLDNVDMLVDAGFSLLEGLGEGLIQALPTLISRAPEIVTKLATEVIYLAPKMVASGIELIVQLFSGLLDPQTWTTSIDKLAEQLGSIKLEFTSLGHNLWDALISAWEAYYNRDFSKWKQYGADIYNQLNGGISTASGGHARDTLTTGIDQMADDIEESADNLYDTSVDSGGKIDKAGSVLTAHANDYGKNAQLAYAAMFEGGYRSMDSSLKHYAEGLDKMLATHKITQDEYDRKLSAYLNNNVDKSSELWWKYYDGIEKRKEQAQAQAQKEAEKAQKEAEKEAKKSADSVKGTITVIGSTILNAFSTMSTTIGTSITDKVKTLASVVGIAWSGLGTSIKKTMEDHTKEIEADAKTYTNTLQGIWDGYVEQLDLWKKIDISDTLTAWQIGDIDRQTAGLQRYEDTYKAVLGRMGDEIDDTEKNLLKKISGMSLEDKTSFTDYLAGMTEAEFNTYMQSYKKYVEQAGELATIEGNSISDINEEVAQSLINDVDYEGIGKTGAEQYLSGFYEGIKNFTVDVGTVGASTAEISQVVPVKSTPAQTQPENITVNINGIQFKTVDELTQALVQAITNTTNRRKAGYAV